MYEEPKDDGVWNRLRRRKVVQWGIAYVAAGWGLLQGLDYVGGAFDWPELVQRLGIVAFAAGLPIALVLAWYHGDKGHQKVTGSEFAILLVLLAIGGGLFWRVGHAPQAQVGTGTARDLRPPAAVKSIAVLPFKNLSSDPEQEYFAEGLAEQVLDRLAKLPQLRVIARSSSFSFKTKGLDATTVAEQLHVSHLLEGSMLRSGDRLRISVQLVNAADASQLWSETYDRTLDDVFKVQDEIAEAVAGQLRIKLLGSANPAEGVDPEAYRLYLQARYVTRSRTEDSYEQATSLYRQALEIDPRFALGWSALATVYSSQAERGLRPVEDGIRLAREALGRALELDPDLADAHATLASIAMNYDSDVAGAARHVQRALELEPLDTSVNNVAGMVALALGRLDLAVEFFRFINARDPVIASAHLNLGLCYFYMGRYDEALASVRTMAQLAPLAAGTHFLLAMILVQTGEPAQALAEISREPGEPWQLIGRAVIHHAMGHAVESDAALAQMIEKYGKDWPYNIASIYAYRGEADAAFAWLDKALAANDSGLRELPLETLFAGIRSDPRWPQFLTRIGRAPDQMAQIRFDVVPPATAN